MTTSRPTSLRSQAPSTVRHRSARCCTCLPVSTSRRPTTGRTIIARLGRDLFGRPGKAPVVSVAQFNTRGAPPDTRWHYASSETEILGLILRAVTGKPVAAFLREKIGQRIGTEVDASWAIDGTGHEVTFCCFNAVF